MKAEGRLFFGILIILMGTGRLWAQEPLGAAKTVTWMRYEFDAGAMSIMSPVKLTPTDIRTENETIAKQLMYGGSIGLVTFVTSYLVLKTDSDRWSTPERDNFVRGFWKGMESTYNENIKGNPHNWATQLSDMRSVAVSGLPATELLYKVGPSNGHLRIVLKGHRCYIASILTSREDHSYIAEKFFKSFVITARTPR